MATARRWTQTRRAGLLDALVRAFPSRPELDELLWHMGEDLDTLTSETHSRSAVLAVIKWAEKRGKLDRLLDEACRQNPDNPELAAVAEQRSPFLVPIPRDHGFVGRAEEISALSRLMRKEGGGERRVALLGMGGAGKTQLVAEYAHRFKTEYPGGIYWVNAAAPLVAEMAKIADKLELPTDELPFLRDERDMEIEGPVRRVRAFEKHLQASPGALLIFDDVMDPQALREPAAGVVPWELPCDLLFTTRRRDPDLRTEVLPIGALSESAALRLLLAGGGRAHILESGPPADIETAKAICHALGRLPLAVILAAAYLGKSRGLSLVDYLSRLRREGGLSTADSGRVDSHRLTTQHEAAVGATLHTQWDALDTEDSRRTLMTAALLGDSSHVSRATLSHLTGLSDESKNGYPAPLEEALNELSDWSLVEDLNQKVVRLHPLVREFALGRISDRAAFEAACARRLWGTLGDMERIDSDVRSRGLDAVLSDLRLGEELGDGEIRASFQRLLRALDREAHSLRREDRAYGAGFLLQQVRNVSFDLGLDDIRGRAEAALANRRLPWLCERLRTSRESDALVRTLAGHTAAVWAVAVLSNGRWALSASHDRTIKVWDISSGCELRSLAGHDEQVNGIATTHDKRLAVSTSDDGTLRVWDLESGSEVHTLTGHAGPVNRVAMVAEERRAISASSDGTLRLWDLASGRLLRTFDGHSDSVNAVAVTADGRRAVSASEDGTLKVWDLERGREIRTLAGHAESVLGVAVAPDGATAVSASADRSLKVWNLANGQEVHALVGHDDWVNGVAVTPDSRYAVSASSDCRLKVWDLRTGAAVHTLGGHSDPVRDVAVTPDGRRAVSAAADETLKVWDLQVDRDRSAPDGHTREVSGVAVSADGRLAVSGSWDHTVRVWQLPECRPVHALEQRSPPESTRTMEEMATLTGRARVERVALTLDGRIAVSALSDKTLRVWDVAAGAALRSLSGHTWDVTSVAIAPDGRTIVSASGDKTLRVWDLWSGVERRTLSGHTNTVNAVAVAPDGSLCISGSQDESVRVWELPSGRELRARREHASAVTAVAAHARLAMSGFEDGTLEVWDIDTGRELQSLRGHTKLVKDIAVTADGRSCISVSDDATLRIWDLASGSCVAMLEAHAPFMSCAVAPDGRTILAGDGAGGLHVIDWVRPPPEPHTSRARASRREERTKIPPGQRTVVPLQATVVRERAPATELSKRRVKILFLAANPCSMSEVRLSREVKRVRDLLRVAGAAETFDFVTKWAVQINELQDALLTEEPDVLHFAGHASEAAQLLFENEDGDAAPAPKEAFVELFGLLPRRPELVVLNACDTAPLATALVEHVTCAIGMNEPIGDDLALQFAVSFYGRLAEGVPVDTAFALACNALALRHVPDGRIPVMRVKSGVDASNLQLDAAVTVPFRGGVTLAESRRKGTPT